MIAFLRGTLDSKKLASSPATAILDVGGVGYELMIPLSTYDALPRPGSVCRLFTSEIIREDSHVLCGFATEEEKELFTLLQSVSGVGPKTAIGALSGANASSIRAAIAGADAKALARLPGIGKRTAERICVELKGKINPIESATAAHSGRNADPGAATFAQAARDAVLALVQLGQSEEAASKAVREITSGSDAPADTAAIVRLALAGRRS